MRVFAGPEEVKSGKADGFAIPLRFLFHFASLVLSFDSSLERWGGVVIRPVENSRARALPKIRKLWKAFGGGCCGVG